MRLRNVTLPIVRGENSDMHGSICGRESRCEVEACVVQPTSR
jgi:hypothetical protein